jgi:hypothetical protein
MRVLKVGARQRDGNSQEHILLPLENSALKGYSSRRSAWHVLAAALAASASLLQACGGSVGDDPTPVLPAPPAVSFALPREIVVLVDPYPSIDAALSDESTIDWDRSTEQARAITLAYAAQELEDHLGCSRQSCSRCVTRHRVR